MSGVGRSVGYYIRVSTDRQAKVQEGSLKNQRQILDAELKRRNLQQTDWGVFVDAYVDEGLSGKTTNRPALKRLIQDVEIGRVDTVMFTELSRLSRSLKDFLNIFEFAQKHQCDLVCLKTDIDTTSPYKSLITKILMIFAEFEREMTSQRTAANAYERSKRGLANGGVAPLGYRRDKARKGYFVVDETESTVTQEIFATYLREQSIKRTTEAVRERHQKGLRLRITRSNIYSLLTNKAYIGVREINKKGPDTEEVPAVWDAIIDQETFDQVQDALQKNREQYHRHSDRGQFVYLFSGVIRCVECGKKLQGKSAWSSTTNRRYHYYAHPGTCPNGGIQRIDARMVNQLVLEWLRDIAENGERFEELRQEGKKRIQHRVTELHAAAARTDEEIAALTTQTDARIDELTRTKADTVRRSIEASIERLESQIEEKHTERRYAEREAEQLKELLGDSSIFEHYQHDIRTVLALIDDENPRKALKPMRSLLAGLAVGHEQIRIALSGLVNRRADDSTLFVIAPPV